MSSTGLVYDERHELHKCLWDDTFPESPNRLFAIYERFQECQFLQRIEPIASIEATDEQILLCHPSSLLERIAASSNAPDIETLENISKQFDTIYLTNDSYKCALLAAGGAIEAARAVATGRCRNAFALIRPPGHHSFEAYPNGFCIFNNMAIAAKQIVKELNLKRVLIVDFDIHAPQGTQRAIADCEEILLISIHNYMGGAVWPFTKETNFDFDGNTINLPLNAPNQRDAEYLTAFQHFLMPIAVEYNPQLILVSAGFDAGLGDPLGGQSVTPACFGHLTRMLMGVAEGKVCLLLEGGYFKPSFIASAEMSMRALLGDSLPHIHIQLPLCPTFIASLWSCFNHQAKRWKSCEKTLELLQLQQLSNGLERVAISPPIYVGQPIFDLFKQLAQENRYPTRNFFPVRPAEKEEVLSNEIDAISANYTFESVPQTPLIDLEVLMFSEATQQKALVECMKNIVDNYRLYELFRDSKSDTMF